MKDGWLTIGELKNKIKELDNGYDHYTAYIDNWSQYQEAKRRNNIISSQVSKMNKVYNEMITLMTDCINKNGASIVYYKKGNFKLVINGKTIGYKKSKYSKMS